MRTSSFANLVKQAAEEQGELTQEWKAYKSLELVLAAHPAAVNARCGDIAAELQCSRGTTLLQYAFRFSNPSVLDLLLRPSECCIGLQANADGETPLHAALEPGRQQLLQLLIRAMLQGRITLATPGATTVLENCYSRWAREYPKEFLAYVSRAPLEPEPEVFGEGLNNVILPNGRCLHWAPSIAACWTVGHIRQVGRLSDFKGFPAAYSGSRRCPPLRIATSASPRYPWPRTSALWASGQCVYPYRI